LLPTAVQQMFCIASALSQHAKVRARHFFALFMLHESDLLRLIIDDRI
jgi:hypothetical protein